MWWLGEVWAAALADLGIRGDVHRGPVRHTRWSSMVCFAGVGAGEVTQDGAKLVGISQRRTRVGARLQSMCHLSVPADHYQALLVGRPPGDEVRALVAAAAVEPAQLRARLAAHLQQR
jgi:lipoate-protein ligase A